MPRPASRISFPSLPRLLCAALALLLSGGLVHAQSEDSEIDILVVYTSAAKQAAGGEANIEGQIDQMVASANTAFRTSGVNIKLRPVHVEELDYVEPTDSDDLGRLQNASDGHMDAVHALRTAVGADLVHLIERWGRNDRSIYCGFAYIGGGESDAFAVTVLDRTVCDPGLAFAHEVGHNFGLQHDRYTNWRSRLSFSGAAHGYVNQKMFEAGAPTNSRWRTLMSYATQCSGRFPCTWANRFSNPALNYNGHPLGVAADQDPPPPDYAGPADARGTLNAQRATVAAYRTPPTTPAVASLKRRSPAVETTNADTLTWRLAFNMDVQNVTSADFEVAGLTTPTVTVTAKGSSQRIYDIQVTGGGLATLTGTASLGFASGQDITKRDDATTKLDATWPDAAQRSYSLDNTAPTTTIAPSTAGGSPFTAIIRFDKDVTGFDAASDVTATSATVAAPVRADARAYTVQVTPNTGATTVTLTVPADKAQDDLGNGNATATQEITYDTTQAKSLTISGLADANAVENADWTSATPTLSGGPVGTATWLTEGTDADHFTIDASTGVLSLAAQDFEHPADANADNVYAVTARAVDTRGNTATWALSVTVTNAVEDIGQAITVSGGTRVLENFGFQGVAYLAKTPVGTEPPLDIITGAEHFGLVKERRIWGVQRYVLWLRGRPDYENPHDADGDNVL